MATKKPIGPQQRGVTPEEAEQSRQQFNKLVSLVPKNLAEKFMRETLERIDKEIQKEKNRHPRDGAMLVKMIVDGPLEDSYRNKNKIVKSLLKSLWKFYLYLLVLVHWFRKERYSKEDLKQETDNLIGTIVRDWLSALSLSKREEKLGQAIRLDELLLPVQSFKETFKDNLDLFGEIDSWLKLALSNTTVLLIPEDKAVELYKAFITNLKKEIDENKKNDFLLTIGAGCAESISNDDQGYFLKSTTES